MDKVFDFFFGSFKKVLGTIIFLVIAWYFTDPDSLMALINAFIRDHERQITGIFTLIVIAGAAWAIFKKK